MFGMRCEECGEVRWSILGRVDVDHTDCPLCGAHMVEERRQPGRTVRQKRAERRDAAKLAAGVRSR